tara:strand:+ start:3930 stop:5051 length:1122 start_codon:yes stop_codon:yes gene_type:complete
MENKIAIIDPVGIKSGMNHYDTFLCNSLTKLGVKTFILSNFTLKSESIHSKIFFGIFFENKFFQAFNFLFGMIQSCIHCKKNQVKVVFIHVFSTHTMSIMTYAISKLFGLRTITIAHDVFSFTHQDNKFYHNLIYNYWSNRIVVHNIYSYNHLLPLIKSKMHNKVSVLKHGSFVGLSDASVTRSSARNFLKLDQNRQYILFFGRLKPAKRLDVLLKAMPNIDSNIHLIIAGHSGKEDFNQYELIIDQLKLKNRLILDINYISENKRELYFKAVDVLALPYEQIFQSGVLLMSMSYGLPVVASAILPFEEVIDDGVNGLLFEKGNSDDLANKINQLFNDKNLINSIPEKAISHMKNHYNWDPIAKGYLEILKLI